MSELPPSAARVADAARRLGLELQIVEMPQSTRTADEAAAACGCAPAQIVKSLVFQGAATGKAVLLLVSGANRVDEAAAADTVGEPLTRPGADFVRDVTGFAIGGVPPLGHVTPLATFIDQDLLAYDRVWAAAGTPRCVFPIAPEALRQAAGAVVFRPSR